MKNKVVFTFLSAILLTITACRDDDLAPIITFDASEKGAYVRLIEQNNADFNLFDLDLSLIHISEPTRPY